MSCLLVQGRCGDAVVLVFDGHVRCKIQVLCRRAGMSTSCGVICGSNCGIPRQFARLLLCHWALIASTGGG